LKILRATAFPAALLLCAAFAGADANVPAVAGAATKASTTQPTTSPSTSAATEPATTVVKRGSLPMKFDASGYFEPVEPFEVKIRPKVYAGELTITAIAANGSAVKKGEKLLEIDPLYIKRQLEAAESEAAVAKANLTKAEADATIARESEALALRMSKDAVKDAEDAVKWWEGVDGPQMLEQTEDQAKQYREMVEDRKDELDQLKKMYKSEELTSATADIVVKRAIRGLEHAKKGLQWEEEHVEKTETYSYPIAKRKVYDSLTQVKQSLASLQAAQAQSKVARQAGLVGVRAALVVAEQKLSDLQADLAKLTVTAPEDGVLWYGGFAQGNWQGGDPKTLKVGEKIAAQQTVMVLYTPGKMKVVADLQEARYFSVPGGTKAVLRPAAFPEMRLEGTCHAGPRTQVVTQQGAFYPMSIEVGEVDAKLIPGMKAGVQVQVPALENALIVPAAAVVDSAVWVVQNGKEEKRAVVTGHAEGKNLEIISGVSEGEKVLSQGKQQ
jgi:HlyD family secretion protein